ncbi:DUF368 domain-containing protein [Geomicrobium sp. JCM 19038]|uniref:DUF368 domain-containing protein n=1 Tax=Geomicrobium sp. JCM 19038 TaxID=1460635 RepID=UPI00045F3A46|nr:DUF368 domain-containing protein [Geomicrobium sp. JCM 19038]GAK09449.1 membrane protein [Geomicrobium sp. JCM 19038]
MNWKNIWKGIAMGMVETVPGVSSSTIAMLVGIYENIIGSISDLTSKHFRRAVLYLIPVGIGIVIGFLLSIQLVQFFLDNYPVPTHFLFIGLVIGMLPFIWFSGMRHFGNAKNIPYQGKHYALMVLFFILLVMLNVVFAPEKTIMTDLVFTDYLFLFFSGWLASIALVLPGISGALILMILGAYYTATNAITALQIDVIATVGMGVVIGVLITGKLVRFLLQHYRQGTYAGIVGLLAGSIIVLFIGIPETIGQVIASVLLLIIGFLFSYLISQRQKM